MESRHGQQIGTPLPPRAQASYGRGQANKSAVIKHSRQGNGAESPSLAQRANLAAVVHRCTVSTPTPPARAVVVHQPSERRLPPDARVGSHDVHSGVRSCFDAVVVGEDRHNKPCGFTLTRIIEASANCRATGAGPPRSVSSWH